MKIFNHKILVHISFIIDETKNLLQKMQNTNFEFDLPVPVASRPPSYTQQSRKLKRRIVTTITTTTITVSKRSRMCTPQLLDEEHIDYFRSMLDEPMSWKTYNDLLEVEEVIHVNYYPFFKLKLTYTSPLDLSNPTYLHIRALYLNQRGEN